MRRRKKKTKSNNTNTVFKINRFSKLLKDVYLGGTIEDCVIDLKGKTARIEAIDLSNTLIVISKIDIFKSKVNEMSLGIGNIDVLIKFLKTISDTKINAVLNPDDYKMILKRSDARRKLTYILTEPELIPSRNERDNPEEDIKNKYIDIQDYSIKLNSLFINDLLKYISLSKSLDLNISFKDEKIVFLCGNENNNQFELTLDGKIKKLSSGVDDINLNINSELIASILNNIDYDEDNPPVLYIGDSQPIAIEEDNTLWAISPIEN